MLYEKQSDLMTIDLSLFGEGGAAGAAGAAGNGSAGTGTATSEGAATGVNGGPPVPQRAGNPLANVKYGKQDSDAFAQAQHSITDGNGNKVTQTSTREQDFETLIKGEYKDLYDARVSKTVQDRIKGSKETVDKYNALSPVLEILSNKYGVKADDVDSLVKAIQDDDSYFEEEALEKGISVQQLKAEKKLAMENENLKKLLEEKRNNEQIEQDVARWMREAEDAKRIYPNLDLREEMSNPRFIDLMKSNQGLSVADAYFMLHKDTIVPQLLQYTAQESAKGVANSVIANRGRPVESGATNTVSSGVKTSVSQLTKADRAEIARRVALGEKITF